MSEGTTEGDDNMDTEDRDIRGLGDHGIYRIPGIGWKGEKDGSGEGAGVRAGGDVHADSPSGSNPISESDTGGNSSRGQG